MNEKLIEKVVKIKGMSCAGCEIRIENEIKKLDGIVKVKASFKNSNVIVIYDSDLIKYETIAECIEKIGYKIDNSEDITKKEDNSVDILLGIAILLFGLYFIIKNTIGFNFLPQINQSMGYGILFIVGFLTSFHCVAMCGGINMTQCVSLENKKNNNFNYIRPSFLYNAGRILSYTIIGGLVGGLGSIINFSSRAKGAVVIFSGIFMIIMGLNMLNIFPWLKRLNPVVKIFGKNIFNKNGKNGPFYIGLLNGLMPCGPLQAMQIYALGTGSFTKGALSMFIFALGTVPLMFGFGVFTSFLSSKFAHKVLKVSAALIMILGFITINRGLAISGVNTTFAKSASLSKAKVDGDVQIINTEIGPSYYPPIVVQKGIPVKWIINVKEKDLNGCNNTIIIPKLGIEKELNPGENIIEFIPEEEGSITYTCWMGMIRSNINVVSDITKIEDEDINKSINEDIQNQTYGGCCSNISQ
ncbi:Sulfite exporter TauE/SafE [Caloramator quimbayensis]|uniref:Sulfite exporter TauE/SafE n=1 Tax=Caloramator quimbayensis TaxID=1147123 RepID=A0A1T4YFA4_9CLOT|nr:sulfite exporter TauE/SafE family protein [Caloramator quimbayensis]SKB00502.1 Sulfite exporter TauE/SafE [Caloramator quimbayensis]